MNDWATVVVVLVAVVAGSCGVEKMETCGC